jgi:hypothetical protein
VCHEHHVHHYYHTAPPTVKEITRKKLAKKLDKINATPEAAIERKEEKILKEAIKEVETIKESIPVPTPMAAPLAKAPKVTKIPAYTASESPDEAPFIKSIVTVSNPDVQEKDVVEVDKPESRVDEDLRSVV